MIRPRPHFGYASYNIALIREDIVSEMYPTVNNKRDPYGLPTYEVRGNLLYPTVNNKSDSYGLAVYDLR